MGKTGRGAYGHGQIKEYRGRFELRLPDGKGGYDYIGSYPTREEAQSMQLVTLVQRGRAGARTTLKQYGEVYLAYAKKHHRAFESERNTWHSVICDAPFIDDAVEDITRTVLFRYANGALLEQPKKRSVLRAGKRTLVKLDALISRKYAQNAFQILRAVLELARNEGLIAENPAEGIVVEADRREVAPRIDYLGQAEIELLLSCIECAAERGLAQPITDYELLADCPHMPFEKRVAFTLATHQCPRAGELAAMDWLLIDLAGKVWHVAKSWGGPTKNGKTRTQALLPRSLRALRVWHRIVGEPSSGLLFPSPYKGKNGAQQRYAKGYDWGWADSPSTVQGLRPGWWRRVGIETKVRFHDMRDTAATHLLSGTWGPKWPVKDVSDFLGHSSTAVTEARYAHLTVDAKVAAACATESVRESGADLARGDSVASPQTACFEGSGSRTRTYGQSVNSPRNRQELRAVAEECAGSAPPQERPRNSGDFDGASPSPSHPAGSQHLDGALSADPVDLALAEALSRAAVAEQWRVVEVLSRELAARREARSATLAPDARHMKRGPGA